MKFEIKNRFSGLVIFSIETDSWKLAVEAAIKSRADLSEANLSRADLYGANLSRANLSRANLYEADLSRANLSRADLSRASLSRANLYEADLYGANLYGTNLYGANLYGANLCGANLYGASLSRADLTEEQLTQFRDDIWAILSGSAFEVEGLKQSIIDGKVDGSTYQGECACLVGTIAKIKNVSIDNLAFVKPNPGRPAEQFFMFIKKGDTPETSKWSALALKWVDQWLHNMKLAFGDKKSNTDEKLHSLYDGLHNPFDHENIYDRNLDEQKNEQEK